MKKFLATFLISLAFLGSFDLALAQENSAPTEIEAPADNGTELYNPLGITDPRELLGRVVQILIGVSGSLALIMFLYGGILFLTSGGKADLAQKGLHVIVWSILGILLIAAAYVATNTVFKALLTGDAVGGG